MNKSVTPAPLPTNQFVFEKIRSENMIYVDKTQLIYNMISNPDYYFLSRPRRFGKSLLVSILKHIYLGNRDYFKGLWIDQHTDWEWKKWPVIVFDFNGISSSDDLALKRGLASALQRNADNYNILLKASDIKEKFIELIKVLNKTTKTKIVILVDEYDKPIIDHLDSEEQIKIAKNNRRIMKEFYGVLKDTEIGSLVEFLFITGVSKFSQVSVFSELNTLNDLSMDKNYAALVGYTQDELEKYFADWIEKWCLDKNETSETIKGQLKVRYDGFRFSAAKTYVYNPISILNALKEQSFDNYWFDTATPTFLINLLLSSDLTIPKIEQAQMPKNSFNSFEPDDINIIAILFQTGYLTIKDVHWSNRFDALFSLDFPNWEVKGAFLEILMMRFGKISHYDFRHKTIINDLSSLRFQLFIDTIQHVFNCIPKMNSHDADFFHNFYYMMIRSACPSGRVIDADDKILLLAEIDHLQFAINFSCKYSVQALLRQIKTTRGIVSPDSDDIYKIAIHFDTNTYTIDNWDVETPEPKTNKGNQYRAKIYISSTYEDLKAHREAVYKTLRQWGHDVIAMEDYVASDERPLDKCLEDVARCDVYIGLFAWRYGYVPPGQEKSITQLEYECAKNAKKTCLIFLLHEDADWKIKFMDADRSKIDQFKNKLQTDHMVQFFKTVDDLKAKVSVSMRGMTGNGRIS